jgi:hypothetical protein
MLLLVVPAVAHGQAVTAAWDPNPPADQVTGYQVCVGTSSLSCNVALASVSASTTAYRFTPAGGTVYYAAIRATNVRGVSPYSSEVRFSIPGFAQPGNQTSTAGSPIATLNLFIADPDGSPLTITHTGLPVGLTIDSAQRRIVGTPSAAGTHSVTVFVNDGLVTVSRSFTWTVAAPVIDTLAPLLTITSHASGLTVMSPTVTIAGDATDSQRGGRGITSVTVNGMAATAGTATGNNMAGWSRLVTLSTGVNTITVRATDGAGNVSTQRITLDYRPWSASGGALMADVNGDGRDDVLIQDMSNDFWLSLASGTGYSTPTVVLLHGGAYNPDGAHIADVNGDGRADVLMQGFDNSFWLSFSTGSGFSPPIVALRHGGPFNPDGVHIADVNGDGRDDVLMQGFDNSFWLSLSTGTGLSATVRVLQHGGPFNPEGVHMADVDGDGRVDLLMQGFDNRFWLSLSTGSGLTLPVMVLQHGGPFNPMGAHLADVNGDGRTDVLMQGLDNSFWLTLSTGAGYGPVAMVLKHGGDFNPYGAHLADVNGDGRADVLMQGFDNRFWLSTSTGSNYTSPTPVLQHGGPFNPFGAHIVDANGDGRADVLMEGGDHRFWLSLSTGPGFASVMMGL